MHAACVRQPLREAWEPNDAPDAEGLTRDSARWMDEEAPGMPDSILEGFHETLTVNRLRVPPELRRSLACTNATRNCRALSGAS